MISHCDLQMCRHRKQKWHTAVSKIAVMHDGSTTAADHQSSPVYVVSITQLSIVSDYHVSAPDLFQGVQVQGFQRRLGDCKCSVVPRIVLVSNSVIHSDHTSVSYIANCKQTVIRSPDVVGSALGFTRMISIFCLVSSTSQLSLQLTERNSTKLC